MILLETISKRLNTMTIPNISCKHKWNSKTELIEKGIYKRDGRLYYSVYQFKENECLFTVK